MLKSNLATVEQEGVRGINVPLGRVGLFLV
jgi:hypothetical protein